MKSFKIISFLLFFCSITSWAQAPQGATLEHPWKGKRVAYLGDSLTDPKNNGSKKKYWSFLSDWLGTTAFVYGRSGREWNNIEQQATKLKQEHGDEVDAIIIFIGTNDYNNGVPIGQWYIESDDSVEAARFNKFPQAKYMRRRRQPSMNTNTYCGRINWALSQLKRMYPSKQIVLLTPLHRGYFYANENNIQPSEEYQNNCGEWFDRYVEKVIEAGRIWSVPVVDTHSLSGIYPLVPEGASLFHDAQTDLLHPNDAGHQRLALTLYYQLATLPGRLD